MSRFGGGVHVLSLSAAEAAATKKTSLCSDEEDAAHPTVDGNDGTLEDIRYSLDEADVKAEVARSTLMNVAPGVSGDEDEVLGPVRSRRQRERAVLELPPR